MKKLVLFCAALICAAAAVRAENDPKPFQIAKAVKLGRNINAVLSTGTFAGSTELAEKPESFECDANCQKCDETTGTCLLCALDRYISENLCLTCPEKKLLRR